VESRAVSGGGYRTADGKVSYQRDQIEAELVQTTIPWSSLRFRGVEANPVLAASLALLAAKPELIHGPLNHEAVSGAIAAPTPDAEALVTVSRALRDGTAFWQRTRPDALAQVLANLQLGRPPMDRVVAALTCPDLSGLWEGSLVADLPSDAESEAVHLMIHQVGCELYMQYESTDLNGRFDRPTTGALALEVDVSDGRERQVRLAIRRFSGGMAEGLRVEMSSPTASESSAGRIRRGLLERTTSDVPTASTPAATSQNRP
jgi:hypothetical protein